MDNKVEVKVQRPIVTNDPNVVWMLYDHAGHEQYIPQKKVTVELRKAMGDGYKIYVMGVWDATANSFILRSQDIAKAST